MNRKRVARTEDLQDAAKRAVISKRFWAKVKKQPGDACWEWTAAVCQPPCQPYGRFTIDGVIGAHRMAWLLSGRTIPAGMFVCHGCDNPRCVRVEHLFIGTPLDNQRDCVSKGRHKSIFGRQPNTTFGTRVNTAKLTEEKVLAIRAAYDPVSRDRVVLAARFGVTRQNIGHIVNRRSWTHI